MAPNIRHKGRSIELLCAQKASLSRPCGLCLLANLAIYPSCRHHENTMKRKAFINKKGDQNRLASETDKPLGLLMHAQDLACLRKPRIPKAESCNCIIHCSGLTA
eukprot:1153748-Pelagomonas_calceolata.AAC.5